MSRGCVTLCNVTTWCNGAVGGVGFYIVCFCATHHPSPAPPGAAVLSSLGDKKKSIASLPTILPLSLSLRMSLLLPAAVSPFSTLHRVYVYVYIYIYIYVPSSPSVCVSGLRASRVCPGYTVCTVSSLAVPGVQQKGVQANNKAFLFFFFYFSTFMHISAPLPLPMSAPVRRGSTKNFEVARNDQDFDTLVSINIFGRASLRMTRCLLFGNVGSHGSRCKNERMKI